MPDIIRLNGESFFHGNNNLLKNNFRFKVNNESFDTNKFLASLLSPAVTKLLSTDETVDSFVINANSYGDFQILLNLIANCEQEIKTEDKEFLCEILEILQNNYLQIELNTNATKYHL